MSRAADQENARMSPDPSLRGVGSGHETKARAEDVQREDHGPI